MARAVVGRSHRQKKESKNDSFFLKIHDFFKECDVDFVKIDNQSMSRRFYKGKDASKDSIGIGLSLAKAIIEKDNGRIVLESEKNKGTIFTIKYFYLKN